MFSSSDKVPFLFASIAPAVIIRHERAIDRTNRAPVVPTYCAQNDAGQIAGVFDERSGECDKVAHYHAFSIIKHPNTGKVDAAAVHATGAATVLFCVLIITTLFSSRVNVCMSEK